MCCSSVAISRSNRLLNFKRILSLVARGDNGCYLFNSEIFEIRIGEDVFWIIEFFFKFYFKCEVLLLLICIEVVVSSSRSTLIRTLRFLRNFFFFNSISPIS